MDNLDARDWLETHGNVLFCYALRQTSNRDVAEDLVQETLLAAWRGRHHFQGHATERSWLIGILKHKISDHYRRLARSRESLCENADALDTRLFRHNGSWREAPSAWGRDPLDAAQSEAFMTALNHCLQGVPDNQRDAFLLRELGEMDASAVSQSMAISTNNLYVLLHRARLQLRRCLERTWFKREET